MANRPFELIGVNSDEDLVELKKAMLAEKITWRSFRNGGSTSGPISAKWNVHGWPTTYVIDEAGVIRHKDLRGEALSAAIEKLVAKAELSSK